MASVIGVAIVGKNNSPLYVREFPCEEPTGGKPCGGEASDLFGLEATAPEPTVAVHTGGGNSGASGRIWFALHAALDRLEQLAFEPETGKKKPVRDTLQARGTGSQATAANSNSNSSSSNSNSNSSSNNNNSNGTESDSDFLGLLLPWGESLVYGYSTSTNIRLLLVVEDGGGGATAPEIARASGRLLADLYGLYQREVMNPFCGLSFAGHPSCANTDHPSFLPSGHLEKAIGARVASFNQRQLGTAGGIR